MKLVRIFALVEVPDDKTEERLVEETTAILVESLNGRVGFVCAREGHAFQFKVLGAMPHEWSKADTTQRFPDEATSFALDDGIIADLDGNCARCSFSQPDKCGCAHPDDDEPATIQEPRS